MKVGIMQPYFAPYIGYFQLIKAVDVFVIYDEIQYTKKGWINRNRILRNGKDELFSLPLKKDSDYLYVNQRNLSEDWSKDRQKLLNIISNSYTKAPYFKTVFPLIESCINYPNSNLFEFIFNSLKLFCNYLNIETEILISSGLQFDNNLRSEDKVLAICKSVNADCYINPIGGIDLYGKGSFAEKGIQLNFIKSKPLIYQQFSSEFVPWLSIIDVLMFNSPEEVNLMLDQYELV